jgi:putative membrane protein
MKLLIRLAISTLSIIIATYILHQGVTIDNYQTALIVAVVLGVVNFFVKPIVTALTLPITLITLGLFMFVVNALMVLLVDYLIPGFSVHGFLWALGFSLLVSLISSFLNTLVRD